VLQAERMADHLTQNCNTGRKSTEEGGKFDMSSSSSSNKILADSNCIYKKVIRIGDQPPTMLVFLKESIVQQLDIDENTSFDQIATSQGVLLKISKNVGSFDDGTEKARRRKDEIIGEQER
jgi:hypothetical protein